MTILQILLRALIPILFFISEAGLAQTRIFLPANISRVRALGMGSAVMSVEDDLGAISFNPANYSLYIEPKSFRMTLFLSPLMPGLIARDPDKFFGEQMESRKRVAASIISFFKGINFTISSLDIGFQFGEPKLLPVDTYKTSGTLHAKSVYKNHFNSVILRLRLAEQVSVGTSLHLMYFESDSTGRKWKIAATYGVSMAPQKNIRFGVSLHTFPSEINKYRMFLEELSNEAINLGVSYRLPWQAIISLDVRNVGVGQNGPREQYFMGVEQELFKQIALRGGVQYHVDDKSFTYSAGLGLFNLNLLHGRHGKFRQSEYALNYAIIYKTLLNDEYLIHALSFFIRI